MAAAITRLLPGDVVEDILARLPVKSLKRFRSVTKSWCSLIQSPEFVSAHISFHKNQACPLINRNKECTPEHECYLEKMSVFSPPIKFTSDEHGRIIFSPCPYDFSKYCPEVMSVLTLLSDQTLDVVCNLEIPNVDDTSPFLHQMYIRSHYRGIVCFIGDLGTYLWNPASKELRILPERPAEGELYAIAFGYNYKRDDYAVVGMYPSKSVSPPPIFKRLSCAGSLQLALYSSATNSWKKLDVELTGRIAINSQSQYDCNLTASIVNGFYHCRVETVDREDLVLSFDLDDEVFFTTPLPDPTTLDPYEYYGKYHGELPFDPDEYYGKYCGYSCTHIQLMEINGSIGALFTPNHWTERDIFYDVWVLGEPGVKSSWKKLFTVGAIVDADYALGANSCGEFFFALRPGADFDLVKYLPSKGEMKKCQLVEGFDLQLVMYTESLVSLY